MRVDESHPFELQGLLAGDSAEIYVWNDNLTGEESAEPFYVSLCR